MSFLFKTFRPRKSKPKPPADMPPDYPLPPTAPPDIRMGAEGVPEEPGPFRFPNGAQGIRLAPRYLDLLPVGMAYWNNLNAHAGQPDIYAFLGTTAGVWLFRIPKDTLQPEAVVNFRPGTGEGWYFSKTEPHWLYLHDGPTLRRHHMLSHQEEVVCNAEQAVGAGATLWQCHSSRDGLTHSMTLRRPGVPDTPAVYQGASGRWQLFPARGNYDECQIDKSGRWLLIKDGADNRVVRVDNGEAWTITDRDGAVGHSDMGEAYVVGEEDQSDPGGVMRKWAFLQHGPVNQGAVYATDWTPMSRYVSHCNAPQPFILLTLADTLYKVYLDGRPTEIVAPTLWDAPAADRLSPAEKYATLPKAALDPHGQWAIWTTNYQGGPLVAFLVRIP